MSLRKRLKETALSTPSLDNMTFEQFMNRSVVDPELLALESKVSDVGSMRLLDKIKGWFGFGKSVKVKSQTLDRLDDIESAIKDYVQPILKAYREEKDVIKLFNSEMEFKALKGKYYLNTDKLETVLEKVDKYLEAVLKNKKEIEKIINESLTDTIDAKSLNFKQMAVINLVNDIEDIAEFTNDLLCVLADMSVNENNMKTTYLITAKHSQNLKDGSAGFMEKISEKDLLDKIKKIRELPDVQVYDALDNGLPVEQIASKDQVDRFIGNPIYHIRKMVVEYDLDKAKKLREQKNFLECVLIEKQMQLANNPVSETLKQQTEYYANEISKYEAAIAEKERI